MTISSFGQKAAVQIQPAMSPATSLCVRSRWRDVQASSHPQAPRAHRCCIIIIRSTVRRAVWCRVFFMRPPIRYWSLLSRRMRTTHTHTFRIIITMPLLRLLSAQWQAPPPPPAPPSTIRKTLRRLFCIYRCSCARPLCKTGSSAKTALLLGMCVPTLAFASVVIQSFFILLSLRSLTCELKGQSMMFASLYNSIFTTFVLLLLLQAGEFASVSAAAAGHQSHSRVRPGAPRLQAR